jgi:hypothetical protein
MSTYLEIVNEVLRRTGQETIDTLVDAESPARQVMDFVNEVYFEILDVAQCKFLEASATLETTGGTALYSLAADADVSFLLKDRLSDATSDRYLVEVDSALMLSSQIYDTGKPVRFWIEGTKLRLHPVPDGTYTIRYYYLKRPSRLVEDGDSSLIPLSWERLLVRGAQSLLEKFLGELESSRYTYGLYLEGLSLLKSKNQIKPRYQMKGYYRGYQGY